MPNIQVGIGFSQSLDPLHAATEAAIQARKNAKQPRPNLAIIFNTAHYDPKDFMPVIRETLGDTTLVGCSTAGIITPEHISLRGLGVMVIGSDENFFSAGYLEQAGEPDLTEPGKTLAGQVLKDAGEHLRKAFIYFADSNIHNHASLLKGMQEIFGTIFPVIGAGSCDDFHFKESWQYCDNVIMKHGIAGFLIGGRANVGVASRHGWKPLGKPRTIDHSEHNLIHSIDGEPAAKIYDEYFGKEAKTMREARLGQISILYPLGIYVPGEKEYLLRNAVNVESNGTIVCQGEVPENSEVHIMLSNKESCILAATEAALEAQTGLRGKKAEAVIIIESMARYKLLGRSAFREIEAIKNVFGHSTPIFGMYSYGEISPTQTDSEKLSLHLKNESISIIAIG